MFWHTHNITSAHRRPALLTLPFTTGSDEANGVGGVISLGLRRRPFSWPLTPTEKASLSSARFLARSVFHDRDFLYSTGTTNINQPIKVKLRGVQLSLAAAATYLSGCYGDSLWHDVVVHMVNRYRHDHNRIDKLSIDVWTFVILDLLFSVYESYCKTERCLHTVGNLLGNTWSIPKLLFWMLASN